MALTRTADGARMRPRIGVAVVAIALLGWGVHPAYAGKGAYWGTYVQPRSGETQLHALQAFEGEIGRRFHVYRLYRPLSDAELHGDVVTTMKRRGEPMYLMVVAKVHGRCVRWRAVAAGRYDAYLRGIARGIKRYEHRVYFSWNHEFEGTCHTGTAREYRASYNHVRRVFAAHHVRNAVWVWAPSAGNFRHDPAKLRRYLPRHYDLIGVDGYNRGDPWVSVTDIFGAAHRFAARHGKRLFIGEVGSDEDPADPSHKAQWITKTAETFKRWNVGVVLWTNAPDVGGNYRADSSNEALAAYRAAGEMTYYRR
jgi:hypothetical protein